MTDTATTNAPGTTGARLIAGAAIIVGLVGIYYNWQFSATWSAATDGNVLGVGWVLEAAFWTLRSIPGAVLCGVSVIAGALCLHGLALPPRRPPTPHKRADGR